MKPGWYLAAFVLFPLVGTVTSQVGGHRLAYQQIPQLAPISAVPALCEEAGSTG